MLNLKKLLTNLCGSIPRFVDATFTTSAAGNVNVSSTIPTGYRPIYAYARNSDTIGYIVLPYRNSGNWYVHVQRYDGQAVASTSVPMTICCAKSISV